MSRKKPSESSIALRREEMKKEVFNVWSNDSLLTSRCQKKKKDLLSNVTHRSSSFVWIHHWTINVSRVPSSFFSPSWHLHFLFNYCQQIMSTSFFFFLFSLQHLLFLTCHTSHRLLPINLRLNFDWMWHAFLLPLATSVLLSSPPSSV